ncbi:unnamed protein product [Discosporangium mesarthrocarpum]
MEEGDAGNGDGEEDLNLRNEDRRNVVLLMNESGIITVEETTKLLLLVAKEDPKTLAALDVDEASMDLQDLAETLRIIASETTGQSGLSVKSVAQVSSEGSKSTVAVEGVAAVSQAVEQGVVGAGEEEGEEEQRVNEEVVRIVGTMGLSDEETRSLRLGIAKGDVYIKAAVQVYRAEELKDTLRRVARLRSREVVASNSSITSTGADCSDEEPPMMCQGNGLPETSISEGGIDLLRAGAEGLFQVCGIHALCLRSLDKNTEEKAPVFVVLKQVIVVLTPVPIFLCCATTVAQYDGVFAPFSFFTLL